MAPQPHHERRRYLRLEQGHMLRHEKYVFDLTGEHEILQEGVVKNYSLGGALFESKSQYNVGDILRLAVSIRGWERYRNEFYKQDKTSRLEPVIILARVVRVQTILPGGVHDTAVEFIGIDEGDRWSLMKHIKAQLKEENKD